MMGELTTIICPRCGREEITDCTFTALDNQIYCVNCIGELINQYRQL